MPALEALPAVSSSPAVAGDREWEAPRPLVTFFLDRDRFALPMEAVREIIRLPVTIPVPLAPPALVGVTNLRGVVLPILDLRTCLALPVVASSEATRVVVVETAGTTVGLVVDRIDQVVEVAATAIDEDGAIQSTLAAELLAGVVRQEGSPLTQLLALEHLVAGQLISPDRGVGGERGEVEAPPARGGKEVEEDERAMVQLVTFFVHEQEHALDLGVVQEIVRLPEEVSRVPGCSSEILGLIRLRGRTLPLLSLRRTLGFADTELNEHSRVVVLGGEEERVGVVVDRVREVLHLERDALEPVPSLLCRATEEEAITALCHLEGGRRLISLLSAAHLLHHRAVAAARVARTDDNQETTMKDEEEYEGEGVQEQERQLVVFHLLDQEYAVGVEVVQEIIRIPEQMTRVPRTPEFISGIVNLRGAVLPVVDMRRRFDLDAAEASERQRIIVLDLHGHATGFIVDAVYEVLRLPVSQIETAPHLSDDQTRLMGRVANLTEGGRMIFVIEPGELLDAEELSMLAAMEREGERNPETATATEAEA